MFTGESSRAWFPSTQWSMIRAAAHGAPQALENLCQKYLRAVYAYFRKDGADRERAADLTQEFFAAKILDPEKRETLLRSAGQASVKFRSYLRQCLKNFAINTAEYERAAKRGGANKLLSLDVEAADRSISLLQGEDPWKAFEQQWAKDVLERVFTRLLSGMEPAAKTILRRTVAGTPDQAISQELNMSPGAVRKARARIVAQGRDLLQDELGQTVETAGQLLEELRALSSVYSLPPWLTSEGQPA